MPSQQVTTEPTPMEGVERIKAVMVYPQQKIGVVQRNPYVMEVDKGRSCYACGGSMYIAQHCKNRGGGPELGIAKD